MRILLFTIGLALASIGCGDGDQDPEAVDNRETCRDRCGMISDSGRSECITAATFAECQDTCLTEAPGTVDSFNDCIVNNELGSGTFFNDGSDQYCPERQCLDILGVEYSTPNN